MNVAVDDQVVQMADEFHFSRDFTRRMCFYFGFPKAKTILQALKKHPSKYALRVNTLQARPQDVVRQFNAKDIQTTRHPEIKDAILISVSGPKELPLLEHTVVAHKNAANDIITGGNLSVSGIKEHTNLSIGDDISIVDKHGTLVGNGVVMMNSHEVEQRRSGVAVKTTNSVYSIPNIQSLKEYLRGQVIEQSIRSMMVGAQVDLKPNDRLLDMTVGEGLMLTHIWQRNEKVPGIRIIIVDNRAKRFEKLDENIKRLRMYKNPFEREKMDATKIFKKYSRDETFDWIILDPKSSRTGLRPKVFDMTNEKTILNASQTQRKLMKQAARLIKPGGTIFYTTESIDPEENEKIVQYAVEELKLTVTKQKFTLGDKGIIDFKGSNLVQRFDPHIHDLQGGFIAKLVK